MALVSEIIRDAYRESNLIAIGTQPTAAQSEEGLTLLNRLVSSVYGTEVGEKLQPIVIGRNNIDRPSGYPWYSQVPNEADWFVPTDSRLLLNLTSAQTVYLDPNPEDGARFAFVDKSSNLATYNFIVDANGRTIGDATSATFNTNGASKTYLYRADTGNWALVSPLTTATTFPFPEEFEDFFVIGLAIRLNPRYQQTADPQTLAAWQRMSRQIKARYRQKKRIRSEVGLLRLSSDPYAYADWLDPTAVFDSGYPYFEH